MSREFLLDDLGDSSAPLGSRPWAISLGHLIESALHDVGFSGESLSTRIELMKLHQGYKSLGFDSFDDYCEGPKTQNGLNITNLKVEIEINNRTIIYASSITKLARQGASTEHNKPVNKQVKYGTNALIAKIRESELQDLKTELAVTIDQWRKAAAQVDELEDALKLIRRSSCENYTVPQYGACIINRPDGRNAVYGADSWCSSCIAHDAIEKAKRQEES